MMIDFLVYNNKVINYIHYRPHGMLYAVEKKIYC